MRTKTAPEVILTIRRDHPISATKALGFDSFSVTGNPAIVRGSTQLTRKTTASDWLIPSQQPQKSQSWRALINPATWIRNALNDRIGIDADVQGA